MDKPIKILFLAANPRDTSQLRLDEEMRGIDQALRQAAFRDRFEIKQHWAVRVVDLQGYLLRHQPDIVHFSGHGSTSSEIILEDNNGNSQPVSSRALSQLFSVLKDNIRCVVLNACYSEQQAQAIVKHIDCVIGMSKAIGDSAAISFAIAFYQALGYGRNVKTAFDLGCVQIDLESLDEQDTPKLLAINCNSQEIVFVHDPAVSINYPKTNTRTAAKSSVPTLKNVEDEFVMLEMPEYSEPEMILIPAGEFFIGSDSKKDKDALDNEFPQHTLWLPDYYLAKTPITNAQYADFVQATGHSQPRHWVHGKPPTGRERHPVVNITWHDAVAYCHWLSEITGKFYRLPSEAEWEKGARGSDGRIYPWGNSKDTKRCNCMEDGKGNTTAVGAYPNGASPYGLLDMAGNVAEKTLSIYRKYPYHLEDGRENIDSKDERVLRGGWFNGLINDARCAYRYGGDPESWGSGGGFRVAWQIV